MTQSNVTLPQPTPPNGHPTAVPNPPSATNGPAISAPVRPTEALVPQSTDAISPFSSDANLTSAQRAAKALAASSLVPEAYRGNIPNVLIAMELASRIGASVLMVMQSLDIVHGRPSWRSQFLIATVNACGRFTPIRFRWFGKQGTDDWGCRAIAKDRSDGEECLGALITIGIAKAEGWYSRSGSKWKTIPEQMLLYRAAAFWARIYAPELSLGIQTSDEVIDTTGYSLPDTPEALRPGDPGSLEAALLAQPAVSQESPTVPDDDNPPCDQQGVQSEEPAGPPTTDPGFKLAAEPTPQSTAATPARRRTREPGED